MMMIKRSQAIGLIGLLLIVVSLPLAYWSSILAKERTLQKPEGTISIFQLYEDAKYAWKKLQTRIDYYGPKITKMYFGTEISTNNNLSTAMSLELLPTFYSMYKITNDTNYLNAAWEMFQDAWNRCVKLVSATDKTGYIWFAYDWKNDTLLNSRAYPIEIFVPFAKEDPRYIPYFELLIAGSHNLFWSPKNLIYAERDSITGTILSKNFHITWKNAAHRKLSQLLWMYDLTKNSTYKKWADDTIEAIYNLRSRTTNLIPREVNADTGTVLDSTISHYDMSNWLGTLELAYYLMGGKTSAGTGNHTYVELINHTAKAISNYMWYANEQRWVYKSEYTTGAKSFNIPEMNSIHVDYSMILAYEITGVKEYLQKAIKAFDSEFMGTDLNIPNGFLMSKSLVIHSPSTYSTQSQFTGNSNLMVSRTAYLIYLYTQDPIYMKKSAYHYNQLINKHKSSKGYSNMVDTSTMQPYPLYNGNAARVFDLAPSLALLSLPNAFVPSSEVIIDWGYGLNVSTPNKYGINGVFTNVKIDLQEKCIVLQKVIANSNGSIYLDFSKDAIINRVECDGLKYYGFTEKILFIEPGTHSYSIFFKVHSDYSYTTITSPYSQTKLSSSSSSSTDTYQGNRIIEFSLFIVLFGFTWIFIKNSRRKAN